MKCNSCGYDYSHVVDTKPNFFRDMITRRRECLKCGLRFNTQEQVKVKEYSTPPPSKILPA